MKQWSEAQNWNIAGKYSLSRLTDKILLNVRLYNIRVSYHTYFTFFSRMSRSHESFLVRSIITYYFLLIEEGVLLIIRVNLCGFSSNASQLMVTDTDLTLRGKAGCGSGLTLPSERLSSV